jgi:hypothetical protein
MSVDNMEPNEFSQKSWSQIRKKLELLKEHATFAVNINAVLGSSNLEQTRQVVAGVKELGFFMTVGLMHDDKGQIEPGLLREQLAATYEEMQGASNKSVFHRSGEGWEWDMLQDGSSPFKCRAGGRYLYIDEFGTVNYCSQRRGEPGTDLLAYTSDDVEREFYTPKGCESQCTIGCVRRVGVRQVAGAGWCLRPGHDGRAASAVSTAAVDDGHHMARGAAASIVLLAANFRSVFILLIARLLGEAALGRSGLASRRWNSSARRGMLGFDSSIIPFLALARQGR